MNEFSQSHRPLTKLLATGQTTQYSSELDDGYYEKGIVKSYTILTTGAQSGNAVINLTHLDTNTGVSFDHDTLIITCAGAMGVFKAAGGETIVISGSTSNNGTFTTHAADANTITVHEHLTTEAAGQPVVIKKQETITNGNNCVIDNNTGLMWMRYQDLKMGIAGDGKMPWTGVPYDLFAFCAACNTASLGGYTDWRVPNYYELLSIFDGEAPTSNPNSTAFPSWVVGYTITSHTKASGTTLAVGLYSYSMNAAEMLKTSSGGNVILVRG